MGGTFWTKSTVQRRLCKLVVSVFTIFTLLMALPPDTKISGLSKVFSATTKVADKSSLGLEDYWNYHEQDLGAGWVAKVNTATGNLVIDKELFNISGRSLPLSEGVSYNSYTQQNVGMGLGWTSYNGLFVQENADGSVTFKDGDATNHTFTKNTDGSYSAPSGIYLTLTKIQTGVFTIKDKDQSIFRFENGHPVSITDEKGNVTSLSYDSNGNLTKVTDPSGKSMVYTYDTNGQLSSITDPSNHKVLFSYDASGRLVGITDPRNNKTTFEYDSLNQLVSFIDGNGHKTTFMIIKGG